MLSKLSEREKFGFAYSTTLEIPTKLTTFTIRVMSEERSGIVKTKLHWLHLSCFDEELK